MRTATRLYFAFASFITSVVPLSYSIQHGNELYSAMMFWAICDIGFVLLFPAPYLKPIYRVLRFLRRKRVLPIPYHNKSMKGCPYC